MPDDWLTDQASARSPLAERLREFSVNGLSFVTDSGNFIIDVTPGHVQDLRGLESRLNLMTGVVECGLFLEIATTVVVARGGRIEVIER